MKREIITSSQNARIKLVRNLLQHGKKRRNEGKFVLEGLRLVEDALETGVSPTFVLLREDAVAENDAIATLESAFFDAGIPYAVVENSIFNDLSETGHSQGILAVYAWPAQQLPPNPDLLLIVDRMADPGNLGTTLRSAVATGIDGVILTPGSVDPFNPKVVRSAMGAHFRIPFARMGWPQITALGLPIVLADANANLSIYDYDWTGPAAVVVGAEAHGFTAATRAIASEIVSIPMAAGESLNAAMAATVILYEWHRQYREFTRQ